MHLRRIVFMGLLVLFLVGVLGLVFKRIRGGSRSLPTLSQEPGVDLLATGVEFSEGEEGSKQWALTADLAKYSQDEGLVLVEKPRITYYMQPDGDQVLVAAVAGEVDQNKNTARLWPEVNATMGESVLKSRDLAYDGKTRVLSLSGGVNIDRPGMLVSAAEARVFLETRRVVAEGEVEAVIYLDDPDMEEMGENSR